MGTDLHLMPVLSKGVWTCHEIIECERDIDLWRSIVALGEIPVGQEVWCHYASGADGECCYGAATSTPYNTPLTWLPAGKLAVAMRDYTKDRYLGWKHNAVSAYLAAMPPEWPIVLYWC